MSKEFGIYEFIEGVVKFPVMKQGEQPVRKEEFITITRVIHFDRIIEIGLYAN